MKKIKVLIINRKMKEGEHVVELFRKYGKYLNRYDLIRFREIEEYNLIQMVSFDYDISEEICDLLNIRFDPDGDDLPEFYDFDYKNTNDDFYEILNTKFSLNEVELTSIENN